MRMIERLSPTARAQPHSGLDVVKLNAVADELPADLLEDGTAAIRIFNCKDD